MKSVSNWRQVLRLVTLLLIASGAIDFCSFDLTDPSASMSEASQIVSWRPHASPLVRADAIKPHDLPDDGCLCCSAVIPIFVASQVPSWAFTWAHFSRSYAHPDICPSRIDRPPRA